MLAEQLSLEFNYGLMPDEPMPEPKYPKKFYPCDGLKIHGPNNLYYSLTDHKGQVYGFLTVVEFLGYDSKRGRKKNAWWRAVCVCGRERICRHTDIIRKTACLICVRLHRKEVYQAREKQKATNQRHNRHWKDVLAGFSPKQRQLFDLMLSRPCQSTDKSHLISVVKETIEMVLGSKDLDADIDYFRGVYTVETRNRSVTAIGMAHGHTETRAW